MCLAAFVLYGLLAGHGKSSGWKVMMALASGAFVYMNRYDMATLLMKLSVSAHDYALMFIRHCNERNDESDEEGCSFNEFLEEFCSGDFKSYVRSLTVTD